MLRFGCVACTLLLVGCNALTGVNDLEEVEQDAATADTSVVVDSAPPDTMVVVDSAAVDADADAADAPRDAPDAACCGALCAKKCADDEACTIDGDCTSGHCVANKCAPCPAGMAPVEVSTTIKYCVDVEEVTNAEYGDFLTSTTTSPPKQPSQCAWNVDFTPLVWTGKLNNAPVRYVDWCDALAYCKSVGKRLCGKIGGGSAGYDTEWASATADEWMRACSAAGTNVYTYPGALDTSACNSKGSPYTSPVAITLFPKCINPYGHHDMTGNVSEWEDSCLSSSGGTDLCRVRGGSFNTSDPRCNFSEIYTRSAQNAYVGIRCCSD